MTKFLLEIPVPAVELLQDNTAESVVVLLVRKVAHFAELVGSPSGAIRESIGPEQSLESVHRLQSANIRIISLLIPNIGIISFGFKYYLGDAHMEVADVESVPRFVGLVVGDGIQRHIHLAQ